MHDKTTILYVTDSDLEPWLAEFCREKLLSAAKGKRIVSVSQKPLNFGDNVCVGDIGRSALSIDKQIRAGLEQVTTPFVAIAEHDCLYHYSHFNFEPPDRENFWYNDNCYLVQLRNKDHPQYNGMYSFFRRRRVQSQLICSRDALAEATDKKIAIISDSNWHSRYYPRSRIGEPGANWLERTQRLIKPDTIHLWKDIKSYITEYHAKDWKTKIPNLDIRHGDNFTGQRRGYRRTWELPYWGKFFEDVLNGASR